MDMSNATAAGPSYGIFDVILGNVPKEEKAEGAEFEPMLNLLKALGNKDEGKTAGGRTDKETAFGTNLDDYKFVNTPGMNAVMNTPENQALLKWAEAQGLSPAKAQATLLLATINAQAKQVQELQMQQVQQVLQQGAGKELAAMSLLNPAWPEMLHPESAATNPLTDSMEPVNVEGMDAYKKLVANMAQETKGSATRGAVEAGAVRELMEKMKVSSPEKIMSTQDFMQIQQQMQEPMQAMPKELKKEMSSGAEPMQVSNEAVGAKAGLVANVGNSGKQSGSDSADTGEKKQSLSEGAQSKILGTGKKSPHLKESSVDYSTIAAADQTPKASMTGIIAKDVFIANPKNDDLRNGIMGEVVQGVHTQAIKGGGEMKLILHPDHLGELKVKVSSKDNKVEVSVTADNDEVAGLIRRSAQDLRDALGDQNLALAKFDVQVSDSSTVATSDSNKSNMDNFLSQQQQLAQDFRDGMSGQDNRSSRGQDFGGDRGVFARGTETKAKTKISAMPMMNRPSANNRLDVVA